MLAIFIAVNTIVLMLVFFVGYQSNDVNISDILLWAIFANRKELAEICWLKGHNHLSKYDNTFTPNITQVIQMLVHKMIQIKHFTRYSLKTKHLVNIEINSHVVVHSLLFLIQEAIPTNI